MYGIIWHGSFARMCRKSRTDWNLERMVFATAIWCALLSIKSLLCSWLYSLWIYTWTDFCYCNRCTDVCIHMCMYVCMHVFMWYYFFVIDAELLLMLNIVVVDHDASVVINWIQPWIWIQPLRNNISKGILSSGEALHMEMTLYSTGQYPLRLKLKLFVHIWDMYGKMRHSIVYSRRRSTNYSWDTDISNPPSKITLLSTGYIDVLCITVNVPLHNS